MMHGEHSQQLFCSPSQLKTRAVAAKTMTMVEPIHLLLFGSAFVVSHGENVVKLDEWSVGG